MLRQFNSCDNAAKTRMLFFTVVAITFLCFIPTLFNNLLLTWDDGYAIVNNEKIREISIKTVHWAFATFYLEDWLPLIWISLALEHAAWGLNPVGYHLTNNVLHALNAGLFFLISLALLKRIRSHNLRGNRIFFCALLAALLFAIHPLRVESVAWAFELKDVLSLLFGLIALRAYLQYVQLQEASAVPANTFSFLSAPVYWMVFCFYCLSLLSKAMLVSFPLVLLILDWFPLKRINRIGIGALLSEKVPLIFCAGITSQILLAAHPLSKMPLSESNLLSRILIAFKSIMGYLLLMVWPVNLSHFRLHPGNIQNFGFEYLFPIFFFLVVTISCVLLIKRWPVCMAVWLIYVITLIPVLGFTQVSSTAMADRYTYVPELAISLLAALAITLIAGRYAASRMITTAVTVATLAVLSFSCYLTVRQISFWKNDITLWSRAIELQPHFSGRMYSERATAYEHAGEYDKALLDMDEAIAIATRKRRPKMEELYFKRSKILMQLGDTNRAMADYNYALSLIPGR